MRTCKNEEIYRLIHDVEGLTLDIPNTAILFVDVHQNDTHAVAVSQGQVDDVGIMCQKGRIQSGHHHQSVHTRIILDPTYQHIYQLNLTHLLPVVRSLPTALRPIPPRAFVAVIIIIIHCSSNQMLDHIVTQHTRPYCLITLHHLSLPLSSIYKWLFL